jgi:PleD family two-component response regulator
MKNETLLVVDDQIENIDLLVDILAQDFNLKVAKSGPEALEIMNSDSIDLVLLDILMEEMDGFEVLRQIKENPETNPIPVIFLTALSEFKDETKGLKMGAVDFISKPINPLVVLARVDAQLTVLRQKKRTGADQCHPQPGK